jgi:Flp pilus assembly protein TadD
MKSLVEIRGLMQAGRKAEALSQLVAASERVSPDRETRLTLARLANELGQHALAADHARMLTAKDSRDSEAWSALGTAEFGLRHPRGAVDALRRAVDISPSYGPARANLAAVLVDQEHAEEALAHAAEARRHGVRPRGVALIEARALIQLDRFDDAERGLLTLLGNDTQDVGAHELLLQLRQLRGDDDPLAALRTAAQPQAAPPRLRLALANAARRLGAAPEAERILRELLRALGPDPTLLTSLATVLQETGSKEETLRVARAALAQVPDDPTAAENFVAAALAGGAHEECTNVGRNARKALTPTPINVARSSFVICFIRLMSYGTWIVSCIS